ncbi:hypothetical protein GMDG_03293 [Pseudogymnoascus destructans 20631-21]|uniref:Rab-GAP TBC domain-containing protein n=1 Tax=Pseudogymnoascus destructans (strain ATCC MYA-4855 / 20631-21) TaxID=658429 RepID=L8G687_PSED2|nr:hypothetical protein GMDG_03293 [Pseudogymnoascus destructans 20631-21]
MDDLGELPSDVAMKKREMVLHDSMVTVRLSEPEPELGGSAAGSGTAAAFAETGGKDKVDESGDKDEDDDEEDDDEDEEEEQEAKIAPTEQITGGVIPEDDTDADTVYETEIARMEVPCVKDREVRRGSHKSQSETESVNWEVLERTEEQEPRDQDTEDSTALLLARLEQENNLLATNPKSGLARAQAEQRVQRRPPSMQQLKQMVNAPSPPALRYSLLPAPAMTDLEFYAAVVQDYKRTAQRLPTLLSKKIRAGIPPPLRGVVWQSMSGARDLVLEEEYERLCGGSSPYEGIIGKDLGRSFPGVEMFRDPNGEGQRMLGKVLRCFSLYDPKIGYCQGLGFLVGPLLMHMGDTQAFCILVRLIENYDLRSCYLPDLSGLHVRIFQFGELLKRHLPALAAHLDHLQVEPAYVSQWFLSFFAVTCPLPMLFRIYDVIFAEGASETMMRVALAVMRKNEERITACAEFEDVMQLLLSRGLWDCYRMDADAFVNDFVSLTGTITNDLLQSLERRYSESQESGKAPAHSADIVSAGSRFLGRIWNSSSKSMTLNPATLAPYRRAGSFLRKSTSKQSMASTLGSGEGSTDSLTTEATSRGSSQSDGASVRGPSTVLSAAVGSQKALASSNNSLNGQIEDLLLALSEMQREQAMLATRLQREREEREEDRVAVRLLIEVLKKNGMEVEGEVTEGERGICMTPENMAGEEAGKKSDEGREGSKHDSPMEHAEASSSAGVTSSTTESSPTETEGSTPTQPSSTVPPPESSPHDSDEQSPGGTPTHISLTIAAASSPTPSTPSIPALLTTLTHRFFTTSNRDSAVLQSKAQLRADLAHAKGQLGMEVSKNQDLARRLLDCEREVSKLGEQVREGHAHVRQGHVERGRLEKVVSELRSRQPGASSSNDGDEGERSDWSRRASAHSSNGLRELKLGRQKSTRSPASGPGGFVKRSSSLYTSMVMGEDEETPPVPLSPGAASLHAPSLAPSLTGGGEGGGDNDALILELVQAKTAEATARQEAEEARGKLEALRRMSGREEWWGDAPCCDGGGDGRGVLGVGEEECEFGGVAGGEK